VRRQPHLDMRTKGIIVFWVLLMLTALMVGIGFFYFLRHEKERLDNSWKRAARREAEFLATDSVNAMNSMQNSLAGDLRELPASDPLPGLRALGRKDPLVRNVFVWESGSLLYPSRDLGISAEEERFRQRYADLFDGHSSWRLPREEETGMARRHGVPQSSLKSVVQSLSKRALRAEYIRESAGDSRSGQRVVVWKPWFAGEDLYIIGYIVESDGELVYGAELEFAAVLGRIVPLMSASPYSDFAFVLRDNRGSPVQILDSPRTDPRREDAIDRIPLAPVLPNWHVEAYPGAGGGPASNAGALALSIGLGLILVLSIIACGSMLFWLARRNMIEAARKTSFVSNVSHELKTPLTTIRMYAEMLGERRVTDASKREHYLRVIIEQSHRLTRLVNNVLDFSRLEQRRKRYVLELLDPVEEARAIVEAQRPRIEKAGMALRIDMPESASQWRIDRDVLEQALLNLIDNAIKYAASGAELTIAWRDAGLFEVCDRGPGIPAGQRERIFRSFHRLDDSITARQSGCGLGLTIARKLLRGFGGDLRYEERRGGGACFVLVLPSGKGDIENEKENTDS